MAKFLGHIPAAFVVSTSMAYFWRNSRTQIGKINAKFTNKIRDNIELATILTRTTLREPSFPNSCKR